MMEAAMHEPTRWPLEGSPDGSNREGGAGGYPYESAYSVSSRGESPPLGMEVDGSDGRGGTWEGSRSEGGDNSNPKRRHRRTYKELNRNIRCPHQNCGRVYASDSSLQPSDPRYVPYEGAHLHPGPPPPPGHHPYHTTSGHPPAHGAEHLAYERTYTYHPEHTPTSPGAAPYRRHHSAQPYPTATHHYQAEHAPHPPTAHGPPPAHPLSITQRPQSTYPTRHHSTPTLSGPTPDYYHRRPSHPMDLTAHPYPSVPAWASPPSNTYPQFRYSEPDRYTEQPYPNNPGERHTPVMPGAVAVPLRQPQPPPLHRPYADSEPAREAHLNRPEYETVHPQNASPSYSHAPPPPPHNGAVYSPNPPTYFAPHGETGPQAQSKYDYHREMQGGETKHEPKFEPGNGGVYYEEEGGPYHYDVYRTQQPREGYTAPAADMDPR